MASQKSTGRKIYKNPPFINIMNLRMFKKREVTAVAEIFVNNKGEQLEWKGNKMRFMVYLLVAGVVSGCMMMHDKIMPMKMAGMDHNQPDSTNLTDPVCGMPVDKEASVTLNHEGGIYYFDSEECSNVFQKNPAHFIQKNMNPDNGNEKNKMSGTAIIGWTAMAVMMAAMMAVMITVWRP